MQVALATVAILLAAACADAGTGPDEGGRQQRLTVYANGAFGPGGTPSEIWINDEYIGTLDQELDPPPMSTCDRAGGVSVTVPRSGRSPCAPCGRPTAPPGAPTPSIVPRRRTAWCSGSARMFPPLGGGGGGSDATDCVNIVSYNGGPLGFAEWENLCGYKVQFAWFDQGYCGPTSAGSGTYIGCGSTLDAFATGSTTALSGRVVWGACRDPYLPVNWRDLDGNGLPSTFSCR
ncbi:MAG: hypothetical protein IPF77_16765 [Gemmatimonadetes bacterium]|nr:hypothetical protein [Gemmatimonadota bacterium]